MSREATSPLAARSAAYLGLRTDHLACGVRARYIAGCRCDLCRRANTAYERKRAVARRNGDWNGHVDAAAVRAHLRSLQRRGVGLRAVSAATDIPRSILQRLAAGTRRKLWARNARKILAVSAAQASDRAHVSAARAWRLIGLLLEEGYTKRDLARRLGYRSPALQLGRERITARNAHRVETLYRRLTT